VKYVVTHVTVLLMVHALLTDVIVVTAHVKRRTNE
jgi:hypothetical protein